MDWLLLAKVVLCFMAMGLFGLVGLVLLKILKSL